jgi:hypothetical protein
MGPWTGGAVSSRWTKGGVDTSHGDASGTEGLRSSPAEAEAGEGDEALPMRGSSGHDRQQRGGVAAALRSISSRGC